MDLKVQTIHDAQSPTEALREVVNEGANTVELPSSVTGDLMTDPAGKMTAEIKTPQIDSNTNIAVINSSKELVEEFGHPNESKGRGGAHQFDVIDKAVDKYVSESKLNADELKSMYTEQGATDALYKQISGATNMMLEASLELTNKAIDEQMELIQKVIDDEKAKGDLANNDAIAQAEQVLATINKYKDEEFRKIEALKEAAEKAPALYDYLRDILKDTKMLMRVYRTPASKKQVIKSCEDLCRIFKLPMPLTDIAAVIGLETIITASISNIINTPKKYNLESMAAFIFSEKTTEDIRAMVMSRAIRFAIKFIAEHSRHFLNKKCAVEDRRVYQYLIIDNSVTAIEFDEALNPTNKLTPLTEDFTQLVADVLIAYFTHIKVIKSN